MANKKLHIIVTGEDDQTRSFTLNKNSIRNFIIASVLTTTFLTGGTLRGHQYYKEYDLVRSEKDALSNQLATITSDLEHFNLEKDEIITKYEQHISQLKQEKAELLEGSISQLDEQSKAIQSVINHIGVEVKVDEDPGHSGGPLIEASDEYCKALLKRTDRYLELIHKMPLGRPVPGKVSSRYGLRTDPLSGTRAFHSGVDIRGKIGTKIYSTGDGVVKKAAYNSSLGYHVLISHGKGYQTIYAHLQKSLVKKGDKITRGQTIGLLGTTGRSTGSHLHYEVRYRGKTVDPMLYLQVANLSVNIKG